MDEIIHVRIPEKEKKLMDQLINEKKFKNEEEFVQESIRHYLFALIEEKLNTVLAQSTMTVENSNASARESRNRIFLHYLREHIVDRDAILTPEEEGILEEGIREFEEGKTKKLEDLERDRGNF